ncbi:TPA: O-antigen ligase family protein [Clostridioides difficile]|uniref:O-antigen ligase family protein n=1 Tax=Clostridioides difficile TaxID=1496 RepID=UPI001C29E125|nr:O-antigen ligase family protein [Clostridioides difficile]MCJ0223465.1 O-antigen ligase family protein [Clostridioides difficile]MCJ0431001.1 O-antigen ligase family protein [Clostridioides difficile]MCU6147399.1 O-antigen ligase family protein [Clostridioides difficile]MDN4815906.1 O-antigen ligase family protein [Clostridioides difficile]HBF0203758.1 O-antigen ligase family protein [Clostridioides difficile]
MLDKYYNRGKIEQVDKIILFILLAMMCVIPMIVHSYDFTNYSPIFTLSIYSSGQRIEIFNFYKTAVLYLGTVIVFLFFMYKIVFLKEELKNRKINILLLILTIGVIFSVIVSDYKDIALFGNVDRFEGALAWFCYIIIFFVLYNIKIDVKNFKLFYFGLFPFLIINLFLGLFELFGINILDYKIIKLILGGGELSGTFWTTLYHYNFMSGIASVIFGVSLLYMLLEKNTKLKMWILLGEVISFTMILTSTSSSGFITMIILIPIILILAWRFADKKDLYLWTGVTFIINLIIYVVLNSFNSTIYEESFSIFGKLNSISILVIPGLILIIVAFLMIMKFVNKKKFFSYTTILLVGFISIGLILFSYNLEKENKVIEANPGSTITKISDSKIFRKVNKLSTDRLNIWSKTIELIDNPILGNGFDTLPYKILSEGKHGTLNSFGDIIDKPHNWYITVLYGSGVIGLIGLIGTILVLIKGAFYNCVDRVENKYIYIFTIGVLAYTIQGMFNDSFAGTSVIFWIFAGLVANQILKTEDMKNES